MSLAGGMVATMAIWSFEVPLSIISYSNQGCVLLYCGPLCVCIPLVASEPVGQRQEACLVAVEERSNFMSVLRIDKQLEERSPEAWVCCRTRTWGKQGVFGLLLVELLDLTLALLREELYSRCQERQLKRTQKSLLWTLQKLWTGSGKRVKWTTVSDLSADHWRTPYLSVEAEARCRHSFLQSHSSCVRSEAQNHLPVSDVII